MRISPRLQAIADMIDEPILYDVGCDHALLDIYCALYKNTTCLAIDVNQNALNSAINNIQKYKLEEQIKPVLNDGLQGIDIFDNSVVVIAGMGTSNIVKIVKNKNINHIIVQSNNELSRLRKEIIKLGYIIDKEVVVKEGHIYNIIISFKKGSKKYNYSDYLIGPFIRHKKYDINQEYIKHLISINDEILSHLPRRKVLKKLHFQLNNYLLKKELV